MSEGGVGSCKGNCKRKSERGSRKGNEKKNCKGSLKWEVSTRRISGALREVMKQVLS